MAGIEQLEIHSKSYIVRWVKVDEGYTISWSLQPHKKSINFGIVKHPGTGATNLTTYQSDLEDAQTDGTIEGKAGLFAKKDATAAPEQLRKKGFKLVSWHGKCDADKVSMGTYDVQAGNGGMFGLVFDNTFSKQTSKNATFVLLTYPTDAPPHGATHLPTIQAGPNASSSASNLGRSAAASESIDSIHSHGIAANGSIASGAGAGASVGAGSVTAAGAAVGAAAAGSHSNGNRPGSSVGLGGASASTQHHVGTLMKRRRKKGQGYARRYFSLDYATCTLSYYHDRNSSALRGAIPLSLAAIAADERRREITIDSGAEVWHLRASNAKDFSEWARALERASRIARGLEHIQEASSPEKPGPRLASARAAVPVENTPQQENREWQQVEALVSRVVGTRDALRRLVKDMDQQRQQHQQQQASKASHSHFLAPSTPAVSEEAGGGEDGASQASSSSAGQPAAADRRPFWRRRSSVSPLAPHAVQAAIASSLAVPTPSTAAATPLPSASSRDKAGGGGGGGTSTHEESSMQDHCEALLSDLDSVVSEFSKLLSHSKLRRTPTATGGSLSARKSYESTSTTEEFFDAAEGGPTFVGSVGSGGGSGGGAGTGDGAGAADRSQLMHIDNHSEADDTPMSETDEVPMHDDSSVSSMDDADDGGGGGDGGAETGDGGADDLFPPKPKSLTPLPITEAVVRRKAIPPSTVMPPSLIAFVRKNVGKDLSTISMPASANEPLSLLQRMSEQLEYAQLLDQAVQQARPEMRLLYVAAFAVSQFSASRAKERAMRKPYNPLLGETYELVRSEQEVPGGLRLLVEKISHRPVRLAMQADAAAWSFAQAPAPSQKFWGKSAELITEGRVRVVLRLADGREERYSWAHATVFLRNVVMGEKYVEPVGTMHVVNDSSGAKAAIEFRSKGMFGGRSEEVQVDVLAPAPNGGAPAATGLSLTGSWTSGLRIVEAGKAAGAEIWHVGPLVDDAARVYGMTRFAAELNEVTALERGKLPATDTRLRPDQRLAEEGQLDEADAIKTRLEEAQRVRRGRTEERGEVHQPRWFVKVASGADGDEVWRLRTGKDGYWEERARGVWTNVENLFEA